LGSAGGWFLTGIGIPVSNKDAFFTQLVIPIKLRYLFQRSSKNRGFRDLDSMVFELSTQTEDIINFKKHINCKKINFFII
jgi:hypothetical protein